MKKGFKIDLNHLWWVAVVAPLLLIVISFLMGGWYWGLMDDQGMVALPGTALERIANIFKGILSSGRLVPTNCFYWALFYKIFEHSPTGFFIFRWFEIVVALGFWGLFIIDVTGKKWSAWAFMAVALGFYRFYDGFFYLSIPEPTGMLFSGLATLFFFRALKPALDHGLKVNGRSMALSFLFLVLAVGAKETFIVIAGAFGFMACLFSFKRKDTKQLLVLGIGLLVLFVGYIFFIKSVIIQGYSAGYEMSNTAKLADNMWLWIAQDLPWHLPWILMTVLLMIFGGRPPIPNVSYLFAFILSILMYIGYLVVLLPWSTGGYYSFPLSIFFALIVTMLIANALERINGALWITIFSVVLCFNVFVSSSALQWHRNYQRDTKSLVQWLAQNVIFEHDLVNGAVVRINADEPAGTIPVMVDRLYDKNYKSFLFTSNVKQVLNDPETKYFLWGLFWGDQDFNRLSPWWTPVFISDNWVMFRRMY